MALIQIGCIMCRTKTRDINVCLRELQWQISHLIPWIMIWGTLVDCEQAKLFLSSFGFHHVWLPLRNLYMMFMWDNGAPMTTPNTCPGLERCSLQLARCNGNGSLLFPFCELPNPNTKPIFITPAGSALKWRLPGSPWVVKTTRFAPSWLVMPSSQA